MASYDRVQSWWVRAFFTTLEMAEDRGFDTQPYADIIKTKNKVFQELSEANRAETGTAHYATYIGHDGHGPRVYLFRGRDDSRRQLAVLFHPGVYVVNISGLEGALENAKSENPNFDPTTAEIVYVVSEIPIKHVAISKTWPNMRIFVYTELVINPTRHIMYDEHQVVDPTSKTYKELLHKVGENERGLTKSLQGLYFSDVIARYFGYKEGQVIRIVNRRSIIHNSIVPERIVYRVVLMNEFK